MTKGELCELLIDGYTTSDKEWISGTVKNQSRTHYEMYKIIDGAGNDWINSRDLQTGINEELSRSGSMPSKKFNPVDHASKELTRDKKGARSQYFKSVYRELFERRKRGIWQYRISPGLFDDAREILSKLRAVSQTEIPAESLSSTDGRKARHMPMIGERAA